MAVSQLSTFNQNAAHGYLASSSYNLFQLVFGKYLSYLISIKQHLEEGV